MPEQSEREMIMEKMKKRLSHWLMGLLAVLMITGLLSGCSGEVDVNEALDVAIEVIEVVEAIESAAAEVDAASIQETTAQSIEETTAEAPETEKTQETVSETPAEPETAAEAEEEPGFSIEEDGHYTSKDEVALYIHTYGKLPSNYISKYDAEDLGWKKKDGEAGQLHVVAPGMSIGGSKFGNYEGLLPEKKGRQYYECDINYVRGNRGAERIVYSNDGLIFYTGDHYESFEQLYPQE